MGLLSVGACLRPPRVPLLCLQYNAYCASMQDGILHKYANDDLCKLHNCTSMLYMVSYYRGDLTWEARHLPKLRIHG